MNTTVKAGISLGVLVGLWTLFMGITGWYKDPALLSVFYLVILIEIGVLIWALRKTASSNSYGRQVGTGTLVSLIGAVIIFIVSYLFTTVFFPNYFADLHAMYAQVLKSQGKSDQEIAALIQSRAALDTPLVNALTGAVATVITGFLASLVLGAFFRKKTAQPPAA
jgi:hypothetical protein